MIDTTGTRKGGDVSPELDKNPFDQMGGDSVMNAPQARPVADQGQIDN